MSTSTSHAESDRPIIVYIIKLTPAPHCANPAYALRRALKGLLRTYGLKCISAAVQTAASVEESRP
jgi:hypothetical protein